jgi:hypothetical protein
VRERKNSPIGPLLVGANGLLIETAAPFAPTAAATGEAAGDAQVDERKFWLAFADADRQWTWRYTPEGMAGQLGLSRQTFIKYLREYEMPPGIQLPQA